MAGSGAGGLKIGREDVLSAIDGDGRFSVAVARMRARLRRPNLDERTIGRALERERRAGVIEPVAQRWRKVEGRSDG